MQESEDSPAIAPASVGDRSESLRRSLRLVVVAWLFGAAWMYATTGASLTRWAQSLGLSHFGFGLLAALPFAGALVQLPASYLLERYGHRQLVFIAVGMVHRGLWAVLALVPWVTPRTWWEPALLALIFASALLGNVINLMWISWMAELVPSRIRGRYFSARSQLAQVVGLLVTVGVGLLLDRATLISQQALMITLSVVFGVAALSGMADFSFFFRVAPPENARPNPHVRLWALIRQPLADRNFRRFMAFTATLTFATGYVGQFVWLYLFDVAHLSNTRANMLLVIVPLALVMASIRMWGRLIDKLGRKPVLVVCGLLVVPGAVVWMFVTPESWIPAYVGVIIVTVAWPGVDTANFNLLLGMSESLSGRRYGSAYIAVNSAAVAVAGVLSGIFGGVVAEALKDLRTTLFGWPLTYHGVLFIISGVLRLAALFWLIGLEDHRAYHTRDALRYMGDSIYSVLQETLIVPGRLLLRLGRWTYRLRPLGTRTKP